MNCATPTITDETETRFRKITKRLHKARKDAEAAKGEAVDFDTPTHLNARTAIALRDATLAYACGVMEAQAVAELWREHVAACTLVKVSGKWKREPSAEKSEELKVTMDLKDGERVYPGTQ